MFSRCQTLAWGVGLLFMASAPAQAVSLDFDQALQAADSHNSARYGDIVEKRVIEFANVGAENGITVDARVTATVKANTNFGGGTASGSQTGANSGFIPNYNTVNAAAEPNDDLGLLFGGLGTAGDVAGITLRFDLFNGSGSLARTFSTPITAASLELMIYDVDGEASQDEEFRAFKADGLTSYRLGTSPQALTATDEGHSVLFSGPGQNFSESDATGAAILLFENTTGFTLDFIATKNSGPDTNAVFSAIDGDLSLATLGDFGTPNVVAPAPVPLPASIWLFAPLGLLPALRRHRRA